MADAGSRGGTAADADSGMPARDSSPGRGGTDSGGGGTSADAGPADAAGGPDVPDRPMGTQPVGASCTADGDCVDGLCLVTHLGGACTLPCSDQATCSDGFGLDCVEIRPGQGGCMPQLMQFPDACTSHDMCPFPLRCRSDEGYCSMAECLWDADCPAGETCHTDARACVPAQCSFDDQCPFPGERCVDGTCGPPACLVDDDCPTAGDYCHPVQQACETPSTCTPGDEEDGCFYNETCEAGLCLPNPCWSACPNPAHQCDPATGHCGAACTDGSTCDAGEACHTQMGLCYPNTPPVAAARVQGADGSWLSGATVPVGGAAALSAAGSADGEGEPLSFGWTLVMHPAESAMAVGDPVGTGETASFTPDVAGTYIIAVVASDPGGLASITDQVLLLAE